MRIGILNLEQYQKSPNSGIGRVIGALLAQWPTLEYVDSQITSSRWPGFRNFRGRLQLPENLDLLLLPQLTGAFTLRECPIPSVVIVHDVGILDCPLDIAEIDWLTRYSIQRSVEGLRNASRIVAVSRFTAERLAHYVPDVTARIVTIPSGVDPLFAAFSPSQHEARRRIEQLIEHPLRTPLLAYVGTERSRKNIPLLLNVLRYLKRDIPMIQLLKIGDAGGESYRQHTLHLMEKLGLDASDVVFVSSLKDKDLAYGYHAADVYVSASLYEGFCLPVAEALASGTPVVAVKQGAVSEVAASLGTLVTPDIPIFADAIRKALTEPRLDADERQTVLDRFSWTHTARRYIEVFQELVT